MLVVRSPPLLFWFTNQRNPWLHTLNDHKTPSTYFSEGRQNLVVKYFYISHNYIVLIVILTQRASRKHYLCPHAGDLLNQSHTELVDHFLSERRCRAQCSDNVTVPLVMTF